MQLHRAGAVPQWEAVPASKQNGWQRLAVSTSGVVTPGNMCSALGLVLVAVGLDYVGFGELWRGLAWLAAGRLCDLVDGVLAERSGTKSPLGEAVDASLDKIAALASLVVFAAFGVVPVWVALIIGLQNAFTAMLTWWGKGRKTVIHPEAAGKIGGAVEWLALLGFVLARSLHGSPAGAVLGAAYALAVVSISLNGYATARYARLIVVRRAS